MSQTSFENQQKNISIHKFSLKKKTPTVWTNNMRLWLRIWKRVSILCRQFLTERATCICERKKNFLSVHKIANFFYHPWKKWILVQILRKSQIHTHKICYKSWRSCEKPFLIISYRESEKCCLKNFTNHENILKVSKQWFFFKFWITVWWLYFIWDCYDNNKKKRTRWHWKNMDGNSSVEIFFFSF